MNAKAWAVFDGDKMWSVDFFRTRVSAQIYAGRRCMVAGEYADALIAAKLPSHIDGVEEFDYHARHAAKHVWKAAKRRNPNFRLVRVTVKP